MLLPLFPRFQRGFLNGVLALGVMLVAGCASAPEQEDAAPDDGLLASTAIVQRMKPEAGERVEVGPFSRLSPGGSLARYWEPYVLQPSNPLTAYRPVRMEGHGCVEADATNGYSAR